MEFPSDPNQATWSDSIPSLPSDDVPLIPYLEEWTASIRRNYQRTLPRTLNDLISSPMPAPQLHTPIWNNTPRPTPTHIPTPEDSGRASFSGLRPNTVFKDRVPTPEPNDVSVKDDDSSIESNYSGDPMIQPCTNYSRYSYWLKIHWQHLMTK